MYSNVKIILLAHIFRGKLPFSLIIVTYKYFNEECKVHLTRKTSIKAVFGLMSLKGIQRRFEMSFTISNLDNSDLMDLMAYEQKCMEITHFEFVTINFV